MKYFLALVLVLGALSGCAGPKDPPPTSIKPLDQGVVAAVRMSLKSDMELAQSSIEVQAENNLLVLRGTVPSEAAKARAEKIALGTPRIEKVANHLTVVPTEGDSDFTKIQ